jgi:acetylornithine deacetylase
MLDGALARRIAAAIDAESTLPILQGCLRIPSFTGKERALAEFFGERMADLGMEVSLPEVEPGRPNAIGVLRGRGGGQSLLFNGHLDHNMVCEGWTRDPFAAEVEDGWVYALGVANMKAGDAAYLAALQGLRRAGVTLAGDVVVEYVVGELEGGKGTRHAIDMGVRADHFVDGEPTELAIVNMHAGVVLLRLEVSGEMRHYTTRTGVVHHAIEDMMAILAELGPSYTPHRPDSWLSFEPHPEFDGLPQHNVGVVRGGMTRECLEWRVALVPDYCYALLDVRIVPGQTPGTVKADLERVIARVRRTRPRLQAEVGLMDRTRHLFMPPFHVPQKAEVVQATAAAHRAVIGSEPEWGGVTKLAGSDAAHLWAAGIPGLLYGPGGRFLSRPDEKVEVRDIVAAARVYALVAADLCSRPVSGR